MTVSVFLLLFSIGAAPPNPEAPLSQSFQARQAGQGDPDYQKGMRALDARQWDDAIEDFDASASREGSNADAALYWKAYAENRAGRREDALDTISDLEQDYPSSRWIKDAKALEVEVRAANGAPVNAGSYSDDDLKLLAVNSLMQSDPDRAVPLLEKILASNNSDKIKDRAMFVLSQTSSPEAGKLLANMARNSSNPELQRKAIQYIGMSGKASQLSAIYDSTSDVNVKRAVLQAFMLSGSRDLLFKIAKTEKDPELRHDAIKQLALTGGTGQLWDLYQSENSMENKKAILQSMFLTGDSSRLTDIARGEKNPELRIAAIKSLGLMGGNGHGDVLVNIYRSDQNRDVRDAVLNALFIQQNARALIDLARAEKDPEMKKQIVSKLALVHSKEATDYMMELLK